MGAGTKPPPARRSRAGTIARRGFLIGSVAIAGGVAFGVWRASRPHANPLARGLAGDAATFNPWVRIGPEGIALIAPHTDLGQGARSLQAALIAEEMDLEFGQFSAETGPPAPAYWNTAGAADAVPFLHRDEGFAAEAARGVFGAVTKVMGLQVTGGSSTAADSFDKLRLAGATARETLKRAAEARTGIAAAELRTEKGTVILPDGTAIPYTDLAAEAAEVEPVDDVALRDPSQWRLLGRPMPRIDIAAKSTGRLDYGIDLRFDGMLNAAPRLNPHRGGALLGFDAAEAERMPGVARIVEVTGGLAVLADNTWNAFRAAEAIRCDWGPSPMPAAMEGHWERLGAAFTEDALDKEWRGEGDADAALSAAADVISLECRAPYLAHAPLEPLSAVAWIGDDGADIWVAHQMPRIAQAMVADIAGLEAEQVRLHNQYSGGSFGHRLEFDVVRLAAEIAVQARGVPVKLTYSREEDFAQDHPRQIAMSRARGAVAEGRVTALDISVAAPAVMIEQFGRAGLPALGPDLQLAAGIWSAPYAIPDLRVRAYRVEGLAPVSSWRSVGASSGGFFIESAMDELIRAAGADPLEERLRLVDWAPARRVLEAVGDMSDWGSDPGPEKGRGLAMVVSFGVPVAEVVEVSRSPSGIRIDKVWVAAEVGRVLDPVNFENQVQGGVVWGLGHAMNCEITYADGAAEQRNYHAFEGMRMHQCPEIIVRGLEDGGHVRGIGEPPVPPAAPALAGAVFDLTGVRLREMPFSKFVDFA